MTYTADANSLAWQFWKHWADGRWEPETHRVINECCHGGTFVDIGAWVGPTSIWAAQAGYSRIVAVEPDPVALGMLTRNTHDLPIECYGVAVLDRDGSCMIEERGDSMARVDVVDPDHPETLTRCLTVESLFAKLRIENVDLIKIDTEGAEFAIIPQAEPFLRSLGAPVHLSLHGWAGTHAEMRSVLAEWTLVGLGDDEWLCVP